MAKRSKRTTRKARKKKQEEMNQQAQKPDIQSSNNELNEELKAIYGHSDENPQDMTTLETNEGSRFARLMMKIILVLLVIAGASWGGFLLWNGSLINPSDEILDTSIEGPEDIKSGELVSYTIDFENIGDVPIASLEMKLNLPPAFEIKTATPAKTDDPNIWTLGSLTPSSDGSVIIEGIFRSQVPTNERLQAFFTYKPANFSSEFEDIENLTVNVNESILDIALEGEEKALSGDDITYTIRVQNTDKEPATNVIVRFESPEDFVISDVSPERVSDTKQEWMLDILEPGDPQEITITGSFSASTDGEQEVFAKAYFASADNVQLLQKEVETKTNVLGGTLDLSLIVDGTNEDQTGSLGETLLVSAQFENTSPDEIGDLVLELDITPAEEGKDLPLDLSSIDLEEGILTGSTFTYSKDQLPDFTSFQPSASGTIDLALPIVGELTETMTDSFTISLMASMQKIGSVESERELVVKPITVALNSDLRASARARYFADNGVEIGSGPLPPEVGETTKYIVLWDIQNSLHPLDDVRMSATLPSDVAWTNNIKADIGSLTFDETTRTVAWEIDRLSLDTKELRAEFELAITPSEDDIGSFFKLINATSVNAQDSKTKDRISIARDVLTSELPDDEQAAQKGVVVE